MGTLVKSGIFSQSNNSKFPKATTSALRENEQQRAIFVLIKTMEMLLPGKIGKMLIRLITVRKEQNIYSIFSKEYFNKRFPSS